MFSATAQFACKSWRFTLGKDKIGGVLRYGIPEFRLPKSVLDDIEYRHLELKGIKIRPNTTIGGAITIEDLFRDGYKAIFVGTGVWKPNSLKIKGESYWCWKCGHGRGKDSNSQGFS